MDAITICNLALAKIQSPMISSLSEHSNESRQCSLLYDYLRRSMLRERQWNFAVTTARLARSQEECVDYRYMYILPQDCMKVLRIVQDGGGSCERSGQSGSFGYLIRGQRLCSDLDKVVIEYTSNVTDENLFDESFVDLFAIRLAAELAVPVGGRTDLMQNYTNMYRAIREEAAAASGNENMRQTVFNPYLEARK